MTTQQEIDNLTWHNAINKLKSILKNLTIKLFTEAPINGRQYARKNGEWDIVASGNNSIQNLNQVLAQGNRTKGIPIIFDKTPSDLEQNFQYPKIEISKDNIKFFAPQRLSDEEGDDTTSNSTILKSTGYDGENVLLLPSNSGKLALEGYADAVVSNNVATNTTTVVLPSATLSSTYPTATRGFKVHCFSIIDGGMIYEKTATGWCQYTATVTT